MGTTKRAGMLVSRAAATAGVMFAGVAAVLGLASAPANAQAGGIVWRGDVDNVVRVEIRGRSANAYAVEGRSPANTSYRVVGSPMDSSRNVRLQLVNGRGDARIVQQPSSRNGYTTIVEIRDSYYPGADRYEFRLISNSGDGRWDDRDGRWDDWRDDRRDDRWDRRDGRREDRRDDRWDRRPGDGRPSGPWHGNGNSSAERAAYQTGYELGRRDYSARVRRDYTRFRSRYDSRTEAEFRRGYNNGYDDAAFRR
jgi:hypothetical protein